MTRLQDTRLLRGDSRALRVLRVLLAERRHRPSAAAYAGAGLAGGAIAALTRRPALLPLAPLLPLALLGASLLSARHEGLDERLQEVLDPEGVDRARRSRLRATVAAAGVPAIVLENASPLWRPSLWTSERPAAAAISNQYDERSGLVEVTAYRGELDDEHLDNLRHDMAQGRARRTAITVEGLQESGMLSADGRTLLFERGDGVNVLVVGGLPVPLRLVTTDLNRLDVT